MQQQTHQLRSIDASIDEQLKNSSLNLNDPKQTGIIIIKSTLTRKLQQLFSISFRKIAIQNHSTSSSRIKDRHRDCMRSIHQFDRKPPTREKSQTQRHSSSSNQIFDELMTFSQDVKTVLNQINKLDRLTQIVDAQKRIEEVVIIERKRLDRLKNKDKFRDRTKIYDTDIAINCIQKLLKFIEELSNGNEEMLSMKGQIESLQQRLEQNGKPTKEKQPKLKTDDYSTNKQNHKAIDTLVTIMRDHKIGNIKRKIQQEAKKFGQIRRQLFEGVLGSITKAEAFQQANLSQITLLSCKLLEEQPSIQKNISHIEKQKRVFEKMLIDSRGDENKAAYYNLIDTSIYLVKLFHNIKEGHQGTRPKSPPKSKRTIGSKSFSNTATKEKQRTATKSKIKEVQVSDSKIEEFSYSKQQQSLKGELTSFVEWVNQFTQNLINQKSIPDKTITVQKQTNDDLKRLVEILYDLIEHQKKQSQDFKDLIETLSFDIQSLKIKQQSLMNLVESKEQRSAEFKDILEEIAQLLFENCIEPDYSLIVPRLKQSLLVKETRKQVSTLEPSQSQILSSACLKYLNTFTYPLISIPELTSQINVSPLFSNLSNQIQRILHQNLTSKQKYAQLQNKHNQDLQNYIQFSRYEVDAKSNENVYLKTTIQNLTQQVLNLRKQISDFNKDNTEADDLRLEINLLKSQNTHNLKKQEEMIFNLQTTVQQSSEIIRSLHEKLNTSISEFDKNIQTLKQEHLNQKHLWEIKIGEFIQKEKELSNKNTTLESDIFLYKRQIDSLKSQCKKTKELQNQDEIVSSLREQNQFLRTDVIEKGRMLHDFEIQKSPRSMKESVSGSFHSITEGDEGFKKKNVNSSSDMLKVQRQQPRLIEDKGAENEIKHLKQKISIVNLQRMRDEGMIDQLKKQIKLKDSQIDVKVFEIQKLKNQVDELKRMDARLRDRLKQYEVQQGSIIMRSSQKWNNQLYLDKTECQTNKSTSALDDRSLLMKKIDILQGQLYNQGAKLLKNNSLREQDLKILMSENELIQQQVRQINTKLVNEKSKHAISSKTLQDSLRKMQFQLAKLRQQAGILREDLRNVGNANVSIAEQIEKPIKSTYQFVTKRFVYKNRNGPSLPSSPKSNKLQNQLKHFQKERESLLSRLKLLSVFTIIDEQNKAFVHNINKIISSLLEFLSTSEEFEQCDYTDVDYVTTLQQYLAHQDYEGYFETLQSFFQDLFLNVFERKNAMLAKQTDQLLFLKDRMERLLSDKIDEIQEEEEKLNSTHRTPLKNYNEQKTESSSHLQNLFKMFLKFKDPKILKEVSQVLNVNHQKEYY